MLYPPVRLRYLLLLLPLLLGAVQPAQAQTRIFKCQGEDGQTIFSQSPCGEDAQETTVRSPNKVAPSDGNEQTWDRVAASNEIRELERQIARTETRIKELEEARDIDVSRLRERGDYGSNTPPGMTYEEGLQPLIDDLEAQYQAKIDERRDEVARMQARIKALSRE